MEEGEWKGDGRQWKGGWRRYEKGEDERGMKRGREKGIEREMEGWMKKRGSAIFF